MNRRGALALVILAVGSGYGAPGLQPRADSNELLTLQSAREYMLQLINRDRASKGLRPVEFDAIAERAGQRHAEEMAEQCYLSHLNLEGKFPDQRYTEMGGRDRVQENVFLAAADATRIGELPLPRVQDPVFRKSELEGIQAAYFNQVPPYDAHRRNILDPHHTHVGIGLSRAGGERGQALSNAQEFISRYAEVDDIPKAAVIGDVLTISGRVQKDVEFHSIEVARDDLPKPRDRASIDRVPSYGFPRAFAVYHPDNRESEGRAAVDMNGTFRALVRMSDNGKAGVYYVRVRVRDRDGVRFYTSQRTVLVRASSAGTR